MEVSETGGGRWLADAESTINSRGSLYNEDRGIFMNRVTKIESEMVVLRNQCRLSYLFQLRAGAVS